MDNFMSINTKVVSLDATIVLPSSIVLEYKDQYSATV